MMQISTVILNRTKPNQLILYPKSLKAWMLIIVKSQKSAIQLFFVYARWMPVIPTVLN